MTESEWLAQRFETHRAHLRAVAWRMLGSEVDADDAVQEAWLRLARTQDGQIENLGGWLTTVVSRVCLDMLRTRSSHPTDSLDRGTSRGEALPIVVPDVMVDLEAEVLLADTLQVALITVLETLSPPERIAFVLHDVFGLAFEEIAPVVERNPESARKLASRARIRLREGSATWQTERREHRALVDAFLIATRQGDARQLLAILDPAIVFRTDGALGMGLVDGELQGAAAVAQEATLFFEMFGAEITTQPAIVDRRSGFVSFRRGQPLSVMAFTIKDGKIVAIDVTVEPSRMERLDLSAFRPPANA